MSTTHTILGAGGVIGRALATTLAARGATLRRIDVVVPPDLPDTVPVDLLDPAAARRAVAHADVVHFAVGLPYRDAVWEAQFRPILRNVLAALATTRTRLVFLDNVYAYGAVDGTMTEATPLAASTRKGAVRRGMLADLAASGVEHVIARAADFYGPGANANGTLNVFVLANLAAGRPASWLGSVDHPHSFTYTADIAGTMATLAGAEDVAGTAWHVPTAPARTVRELAALAAEQLGRSAPGFQVLDAPTLAQYAQQDAVMAATAEMFYQFDRPYVLDSSRYERRFGEQPTPYAEGIRATLAALPVLPDAATSPRQSTPSASAHH